ncbi:hypothetical protein [Psychrobacillus sp. NPDC096623]|uniref:hypothetical protein n=1 Tax=Psychrobacillus sp. NPDC096623 TaxID=3364492 RepID=UPI00380408E1
MIDKMRNFPTKKDMTYWILILIIILTVVSVWRTNDSSMLTNQLTLGGTLLSIFLAIIAIIFSFIQSSDTSSHNKEIIVKINELTQNMKYLNDLNSDTADEIVKRKRNLKEIDGILDELKLEIGNKNLSTNKDKLNEILVKIEESQSNSSNSDEIYSEILVLEKMLYIII